MPQASAGHYPFLCSTHIYSFQAGTSNTFHLATVCSWSSEIGVNHRYCLYLDTCKVVLFIQCITYGYSCLQIISIYFTTFEQLLSKLTIFPFFIFTFNLFTILFIHYIQKLYLRIFFYYDY